MSFPGTLGEITSIATTDLGRRADIPLSVASQRANMAQQIVSEEASVALLESCVTSAITADHFKMQLPSNLNELISVSLWKEDSKGTVSSAHTLNRISIADAASRTTRPTGQPKDFAIFTNDIHVYPSSDTTYRLEAKFRSYPQVLTSNASTPSLSTAWRFPWLIKTKELLAEYIKDTDQKDRYESEYFRTISRLKNDEARRQAYEGSEPSVSLAAYSSTRRSRRRRRRDRKWSDD